MRSACQVSKSRKTISWLPNLRFKLWADNSRKFIRLIFWHLGDSFGKILTFSAFFVLFKSAIYFFALDNAIPAYGEYYNQNLFDDVQIDRPKCIES
jgi:hypothetical protein